MRHGRCKSCSLRAASKNGIPPLLPMYRAMASSSIDADRFQLLSQHEFVLGSFLNERECIKDAQRPTPGDHPSPGQGQATLTPTYSFRSPARVGQNKAGMER